MSVVIKAVTPSIKLEGTNASPIHLRRLKSVGLPTNAPLCAATSAEEASASALAAPIGCSCSSSRTVVAPLLVVVSAAAAGAERHKTTAQAKTKTTNTPYPIDHKTPWVASLKLGSTTSG